MIVGQGNRHIPPPEFLLVMASTMKHFMLLNRLQLAESISYFGTKNNTLKHRVSILEGKSRSAEDAVLCRGLGCPQFFHPPSPPQGRTAQTHRRGATLIKCSPGSL